MESPVPAETTGAVDPAGRSHGRRRWLRPVLTVLVLAALVTAGVVNHERVAGWVSELVGVRWDWVLASAVVQLVSFQCVAHLQRLLLRAGGGNGDLRAVSGTNYAANAISLGLPVAGAAASAAYTYRRWHDLGNSTALVGWALAMTGISSTVTLALVIAVGLAVTGSTLGALGAFAATAAGAVPVLAAVLAIRHEPTRELVGRVLGRGARVLGRWVPALRGTNVAARIIDLLASLGSYRLSTGRSIGAGLFSLGNWVLDAGSLALAVVAVGAPVPWQGLLLAWAAGALATSVRLTPGGIGVVEATLASALVAAGMPASQAVPAVVVYRLVSLWLPAAMGALCLVISPRPAVAEQQPG
ncbi:lysylphosphatidylglycerol synthase transmembrane domain-containing protein [Modestobacter sp. SSW1-42]|uniref:lysylphosphatidylglycerol synthase transmembrane domain-containing protein n=1 Tax=Modestobacter sp. SSW1-42 TaxID=596372 RepID=UPI003987FE86